MPRDLPAFDVETKPGPVEQTLIEARELISTPEKWKPAAGMRTGRPLCMMGALANTPGAFGRAFEFVTDAIGARYIPRWNDAHTHSEVIAAFDRAIALAHAEGA